MPNLVKNAVIASLCTFAMTMANAADDKTYPGSMGVKYSGPAPVYTTSAIGNSSTTSWMYVDLPAINDDNNDIAASNVRVIDLSGTGNISCNVNQAYRSGSSFFGWWGSTRTSTGASSSPQTLNTGPLGGTNMTVHTYFSCAIPPKYGSNISYIISYYVNEG